MEEICNKFDGGVLGESWAEQYECGGTYLYICLFYFIYRMITENDNGFNYLQSVLLDTDIPDFDFDDSLFSNMIPNPDFVVNDESLECHGMMSSEYSSEVKTANNSITIIEDITKDTIKSSRIANKKDKVVYKANKQIRL